MEQTNYYVKLLQEGQVLLEKYKKDGKIILDLASLFNITTSLMSSIEKSDLDGANKKEFCIDVIETLIYKTDLLDEEKGVLLEFVKKSLGGFIDNIIDVVNKKYNFDVKKPNLFARLQKIFLCKK